jgi:geranylgeranyl pyrophosphate synthase
MQFQTSTLQPLEPDSIEYLLDMVETKMMAFTNASSVRVSRQSTSASDAAVYHLRVGGQRVRAKLALQAGLALGVSKADVVTIATTVELLHNASLVHDDIQDRDELRRGQQAVWVKFGVNTAICTGDLLLSAAYAALCKLEDPRALPAMISLIHERTSMAIDGQCADLMASTDVMGGIDSAITRYQQIAIAKSGALLCLPIELSLLASGQDCYLSDARHAVESFAVGYQIVDDLNDLQSDSRTGAYPSALNIVSIYKDSGCAGEPSVSARKIGRHHLDVAIQSAALLPCGAGVLLADYAGRLRQLLAEQN